MPTSTLTSKGQTTIPKAIREALDLHPGDRLDFTLEADGRVVLRPATIDITALDGLVDRSGRVPVSVDEMRDVVADAARDAFERSV